MTDHTKLEKLRLCGRLETFSTSRHHLGLYKNVGLTATYVFHQPDSSSIERLVFAALRVVIAEHSILSAIALNEDKSFPDVYFARLPKIDLRTCVAFRNRSTSSPADEEVDKELDSILAEQHNQDFKAELGTAPFWRLLVLKPITETLEFTAIWSFHHALADGTSAILFHKSFLAALNSPNAPSGEDFLVKSPTTNLLPPLEDLHPLPVSWNFFFQALLGALFPNIFNKRPAKLWTGSPVPSGSNPCIRPVFRTLVISAEITGKLVSISRRERTSVTATLQCLLAASLFANLSGSDTETIKIECPISMRPFLEIQESQMTNAIGQCTHLHTRAPSTSEAVELLPYFSWAEARAVKAAIQQEVTKEGHDSPIALLKYVFDMPKYFKDELGKPRKSTAELSNIGAWKGGQTPEAKWRVGRMTFSQCPALISSAISVNVVTDGDRNLVINFSWNEGAVEDEMMVKVISGFGENLHKLVGSFEDQ